METEVPEAVRPGQIIIDLTTQDVLAERPSSAIRRYLDDCASIGADREQIRDLALRSIRHLNGGGKQREQTGMSRRVEAQWYDALKRGAPDWSVYGTDYYLAELWACWAVYSRPYLRVLSQSNKVDGRSLLEHVGRVARVLDLGCGVGLTTAALTQLFPDAEVVGTNLEGTRQIVLARRNAERYGFRIELEPTEEVDVVFASEYFEHFPSPVRHLQDVLRVARPRVLLVANAFGTKSIGHFPRYFVRGQWEDAACTKREFASEMVDQGYRKVKTGFWNGRPTYWRRQ